MGNLFGSTAGGILVLILFIAVIGLLAFCISLSMRLNRLTRRYRLFMKGNDGKSVEKAMATRFKDMDKVQERQASNSEQLTQLRRSIDRTLSKYGIVKYDAFEDVGGKMSFALAMLDDNNTGFVLNTIHSRDNCFVYLKEVVKGESYIMLSDEEIEALRMVSSVGEEDV
jgi:hypothetical protein